MAVGEMLDAIYEAAVVPELWGRAISRLSAGVGATGGLIASARHDRVLHIVSDSEPLTEAWAVIGERFPNASNQRTQRVLSHGRFGFITDLDVFTPDELRLDPLYSDILVPRGFGSGIATSIQAPSGDSFVVNLERSVADGPFDRPTIRLLDGLRPHIARAVLAASRLATERASGAMAAFDILDLPAAVLGPRGRPLAVNALLAALMPETVLDRHGRLVLTNAGADTLFSDAISALDRCVDTGGIRSIPIPAHDDRPGSILHLTPIRGAARDVFSQAVAIVFLTPLVPRGSPDPSVVRGLFDLTPAEAVLATMIADGSTLRAASSRLGWTYETARTTLKRVMGKTGSARQADLVGLLQAGGLVRAARGPRSG